MVQIAFLGLGAMGARMVGRLLGAGHSVTVWNRDPSRAAPLVAMGATTASSPAAAAEGAAVVFAMVRDDAASRAVWLDPASGAFAGMRSGAVAVDCSTVSLDWARTLAAESERRELRFLDAPVAGSRPQAAAGQLIFIVGGSAETLAEVEPVLRAMGSAVHHAGDSGSGVAVKLALNALLGIQAATVAELIGLLSRAGVDSLRAVEILGATPVISPSTKAAAGAMIAGNFDPMFPLNLAEKDLGYVEAASPSPLPMTQAARVVLQAAIAAGYGEDNLTAVARLYRRD